MTEPATITVSLKLLTAALIAALGTPILTFVYGDAQPGKSAVTYLFFGSIIGAAVFYGIIIVAPQL